MRTRRNSVGLWLSDAELTHLRQQCQITGLNTNTYLDVYKRQVGDTLRIRLFQRSFVPKIVAS